MLLIIKIQYKKDNFMKASIAIFSLITSCSLAAHVWSDNDYDKVETKSLSMSSSDLTSFAIEAGAGSLTLIGEESNEINITADIFQKKSGDKYCLTLGAQNGSKDVALLQANTCDNNNGTRIDLTVRLPKSLITTITDGSGSIHVSNASVENINDGSGSINIEDNKVSLTVNDGSGSIHVTQLEGDVSIHDGSGSITLNSITGDVEVSDGSGSINVDDANSFTLVSDGSGGVELTNVKKTF